MVLFRLSRRINKFLGPPLLRYGLSARYALGKRPRDNLLLDSVFLLPISQKMISLEVQEDAREKLTPKVPSKFDKFAEKTFDRIFGKGPQEEYHDEIGNPRLEAFEHYMCPILVPNERWSDVMRWQLHYRFLNWVRVEFLAAKYGLDLKEAVEAYPKLGKGPQASLTRTKRKMGIFATNRPEEEGEKEWLPMLPTVNTVRKAFQMQSWSRKKNGDAAWKRMEELTKELGGEVIELPGSWLRIAQIDPETDVSALSVQDILEVAGASVSSQGSFNLFCEECNVYQLWTREYVEGLAAYLLGQAQRYNGDTLILDIGAGDGFLAQLLREAFESEPPKERRQPRSRRRTNVPKQSSPKRIPEVIAVDDGSWNILPGAPVENLGVVEALEKYCKDDSRRVIILCSWMPMGIDWSAAFRDHGVDEYILIGEYDDGSCGDYLRTWGNWELKLVDPTAAQDSPTEDMPMIPLYEAEGYEKVELQSLSDYHFSRFDSSKSCGSKTFSFRRTDAAT